MAVSIDGVRIVTGADIARVLPRIDAIGAMERAFKAYSAGAVRVPPVAEILFDDPPGEAHIKAGHAAGDDVFVVKVATGFYRNPALGLASSSGLMLAFDATTGRPRAVLLDDGALTDLRTAAAGAVAAKWLAPHPIRRIAIIGSGIQARLQADLLRSVTACRSLALWARNADAAERCAGDVAAMGYDVTRATSTAHAGNDAALIVTTTASKTALLRAEDIAPGTHITAVGADSEGKQELDAGILAKADLVVADSRSQAMQRGDIAHALAAGVLAAEAVIELGALIAGAATGRTSKAQISVADLTGVAAQDIEIAKAVLAAIEAEA